MSRQTSPEVDVTLRSWADANAPAPSPVLALFIGPVRPLPSPGRSATPAHLRGLARLSLGTKVFVGVAALAMTGAAAVGAAHVAGTDSYDRRPPTSSGPAVPGVDDSRSPTAGSTTLGSPSASDNARPTHQPTTPAPALTRSATPHDDSTNPDAPEPREEPSSQSTSAPDGSDDGDSHSPATTDPDTQDASSEPTHSADSGRTAQPAPPGDNSEPEPER